MNKNLKANFFVILGPLLYAIGINFFITPLNLYSGGIVGICQVVRTIIVDLFSLDLNFDLAGILSLALNIPLLIIAYKTISGKFFIKTLISTIVLNIGLTFITLETPILEDTLCSCLIGGALGGVGLGLSLRAGGSTGGTDIVGMYLVKTNKKITLGQITLFIDACVYLVCAFLFNIETAIYSIIFSMICAFVIDKTHHQTIKVNALIFTNKYEIANEINKKLVRGSTSWEGKGDYTGNKKAGTI